MNNGTNNGHNGATPFHETVLDAANVAVARAIERHRRLGESIAVWRDGQVVIVPPEEILPMSEEEWRNGGNRQAS